MKINSIFRVVFYLLLPVFGSCSFAVTYESLYQITVSSSTAYIFKAVLNDSTEVQVSSQASGDYTLCSVPLQIDRKTSSSLSDEEFQKKCPLPSSLFKEFAVYSVATTSEETTETLVKTVTVEDSQWVYQRLSRNMGVYLYEYK